MKFLFDVIVMWVLVPEFMPVCVIIPVVSSIVKVKSNGLGQATPPSLSLIEKQVATPEASIVILARIHLLLASAVRLFTRQVPARSA